MKYVHGKKDFKIPALGLGTYRLTDQGAVDMVSAALDIGYRHIDTASVYKNQDAIGEAVEKSSVDREDIFITSKVWHTNLHYEGVKTEIEQTLNLLNTDYVDLYLIHWPNRNIPLEDTLKALHEIRDEGKVRYIGVSNFTIHHLEDEKELGGDIVCNQVEFHPTFYQKELLEYCKNEDIVLTAYSPLAQGADLKEPVIKEIAEKYDVSTAQVVLNWILAKGAVAIPRSNKREHIRDNWETLSWNLEAEDIEQIDEINRDNRILDFGFSEFDY
ncbi:MAG: aldo/keto reductase [Candidatus Paceibacterota bacterium]